MLLKQLVEDHGEERVAELYGCKPSYIKRCLSPNSKSKVDRVKLVNVAKKLNQQ